ncbi:hypothetical protein [Lentzea sp. E54]|uniref:hypothetical protein n=1 Tax=Lentzea xerophila TaxID=3435883 RepID=UPI003DA3B61A
MGGLLRLVDELLRLAARADRWLGNAAGLSDPAPTAFDRIDLDGDGNLIVGELVIAVHEFRHGRLDVPLLG